MLRNLDIISLKNNIFVVWFDKIKQKIIFNQNGF